MCVSHINGGQLTLQVENAGIATRFRFFAPEVLRKLAAFPLPEPITQIKIALSTGKHPFLQPKPDSEGNEREKKGTEHQSTGAETTRSERKSKIKRTLSTKAADDIKNTADGIKDEALKEALYRLLQHVEV